MDLPSIVRYLTCSKHSMEKAMAPHSSTLAWKIPWTEEPGRLESMGSRRVWQDWVTSLSLFTFMCWRRKWQPTPASIQWSSLVAHLVKNLPAMWETWVWSLGWEDPVEKGTAPTTSVFWPGEFMDCLVHGVAKSWTGLSNFHFQALYKACVFCIWLSLFTKIKTF